MFAVCFFRRGGIIVFGYLINKVLIILFCLSFSADFWKCAAHVVAYEGINMALIVR